MARANASGDRRRKYSLEARDIAVRLRMEGWGPAGIAPRVDLSPQIVKNLLRYERVCRGREYPPISKADRPACNIVVILDRDSGWSLAHAAAARNIAPRELARRLLVAVLAEPVVAANLLDEDWPPASGDEFQTVLERAE